MRRLLIVSVLFSSSLALANGHHSSGGGSSSSDPDFDCIRWEKVGTAADGMDAGVVDAGRTDGGSMSADAGPKSDGDAGQSSGASSVDAGARDMVMVPGVHHGGVHDGERCVEHALAFGCEVGPARPRSATGDLALALAAAGLVVLALRPRRRVKV